MSHTFIVAEIGSWFDPLDAYDKVDDASQSGYVGVVIKGSQGARWRRDEIATLVDHAHEHGMLVGYLHYCEPGNGDAELEAVNLASLTSDLVFELGVWYELDDLGGVDATAVASWLQPLIDATSSPDRRAAVLAEAGLFSSLIGLDYGVRRIVRGAQIDPPVKCWASEVVQPTGGDTSSAFELYALASPRGINPPSNAPVVAPQPAAELAAASVAAEPAAPTESAQTGSDDESSAGSSPTETPAELATDTTPES